MGAGGFMNIMKGGGMMNIMKGGGMMNSIGAGGMMNNMGGRMMNDIYGMHSMGGRYGQQPGGVVLLVSNIPDQIAKVGGNKLCISNSRVVTLLNKRIAENKELQRDFSNSRNHRYRNHATAAKLTRNLGPPSSTLHVANLPEELTHSHVKDMFTEAGFTVKESVECGASANMALLTMASPDEALLALSVMHNHAPGQYKFKNVAGLCVSFSVKK